MSVPGYQSLIRLFQPEYAGKMQFNLAVLDDLAREEGENPRITDLLTTLNDHLVKRSRGHPLAMHIAERGRPTARSVYHRRWVLYGRPSIGMILCKTKKRTIVEYALRESNKPIGVSKYRMASTLPAGAMQAGRKAGGYLWQRHHEHC